MHEVDAPSIYRLSWPFFCWLRLSSPALPKLPACANRPPQWTWPRTAVWAPDGNRHPVDARGRWHSRRRAPGGPQMGKFSATVPLERRTPRRRPDDHRRLFRICSMTKAITSMAAMVLWERGQIGLDDPVSTYLPEFAEIGVLDTLLDDTTGVYSPPSRPMTIRHLMTHTSGIPYGDIGDSRFAKLYAETASWTSVPHRRAHDTGQRLADGPHGIGPLIPENGGPTDWGSTCSSPSSKSPGRPYAEFLRTELLDPLGMDHTHFVLPGRTSRTTWSKCSKRTQKEHGSPTSTPLTPRSTPPGKIGPVLRGRWIDEHGIGLCPVPANDRGPRRHPRRAVARGIHHRHPARRSRPGIGGRGLVPGARSSGFGNA